MPRVQSPLSSLQAKGTKLTLFLTCQGYYVYCVTYVPRVLRPFVSYVPRVQSSLCFLRAKGLFHIVSYVPNILSLLYFYVLKFT